MLFLAAAASSLPNTRTTPAGARRPNQDRYRLLVDRITECAPGAPAPPRPGPPLVQRARRGRMCAVIDGVGSAPRAGAAASHVADRLVDFLRDASTPASLDALTALLATINAEIRAWGVLEDGSSPLGAAALTVAWFPQPDDDADDRLTVHVLHAGDTSALWLSPHAGAVRALVTPHSEGGALTNYAGVGTRFHLQHARCTLAPGDLLLLATDGALHGQTHDEILDLARKLSTPAALAQAITARARARGSVDDATAVALEVDEE